MSRQREFTLQVRFTTKRPSDYEAVRDLMIEQARGVNALFTLLAGQGVPLPDIQLKSEDFIDGSSLIDWREPE